MVDQLDMGSHLAPQGKGKRETLIHFDDSEGDRVSGLLSMNLWGNAPLSSPFLSLFFCFVFFLEFRSCSEAVGGSIRSAGRFSWDES